MKRNHGGWSSVGNQLAACSMGRDQGPQDKRERPVNPMTTSSP
jgi:hypothetical protein